MSLGNHEEAGGFRPAGSLDLYSAGTHQPALAEALRSGGAPVVDLGEATGCDTSGAQLLLSAVKTAAAGGKTVSFKNVSPGMQESFRRLGLPDIFQPSSDLK